MTPATGGAPASAVIIAVGSELLTPHKVDTNSLYLTEQLDRMGVAGAGESWSPATTPTRSATPYDRRCGRGNWSS